MLMMQADRAKYAEIVILGDRAEILEPSFHCRRPLVLLIALENLHPGRLLVSHVYS